MSIQPLRYEKTKVVPFVESDVFAHNLEARFAIARLAIGSIVTVGRDEEFYGSLKLRSNVYLDAGFVSPDDLDARGTEFDADDERAVHFAALERTTNPKLARVVANMRLVVKGSGEVPLPLERYYPEVFENEQARPQSTEVSRLISRHEDVTVQNALTWSMFVAGLRHVERNNLGPVYGLMEPRLARSLSSQGVPLTTLADERYIPAINATKRPVEISATGLGKVIKQRGDFGIDLSTKNIAYIDIATDTALSSDYAEEKEPV